MAVAIHGPDWSFAREVTDPIPQLAQLRPEGPWIPWPNHAVQQSQPQKPQPLPSEAMPIVLWERPPKPAGWSAIWEVLPPPPPPPLGQDGVWIWVPEGEEAPVGGMVPHEGAFLPCVDVDDDAEAGLPSSTSFGGFGNVPIQAAAESNMCHDKLPATTELVATGPESMQMMQAALPTTDMVQSYSQNLLQSGTSALPSSNAKDAFGLAADGMPKSASLSPNQYPSHQSIPEASGERPSQGHAPQVWNPFPTQTTAIDPPVEQAWNPWASEGDGPFSKSLQETHRRIVGDIGAFNSDDWRSSAPTPSTRSLQVPAPPAASWNGSCGLQNQSCSQLPAQLSHLSPFGLEDFNSLESTSFWQVQPSVPSAPSSPVPNSRLNQAPVGITSQGSAPGRKSGPSVGSGSQGFLTSTSDGLEVTYPVGPLIPHSQLRTSGPMQTPGTSGHQRPSSIHAGTAGPPPWPLPHAGLPTPRVQLLDVTGAGVPSSCGVGRFDFDVLGPMQPRSGATWMNDPKLAQMPVAQVAERNRHAPPVLLDVTGGHVFPDD